MAALARGRDLLGLSSAEPLRGEPKTQRSRRAAGSSVLTKACIVAPAGVSVGVKPHS